MKMRNLFNLIEDADEISTLFSKVETPEQMISLLERIKKQGAPELLESVQSLRLSLAAVMDDVLELGGPIGADDDDNFTSDGVDEDEDLFTGLGEEDANPAPESAEPEKKS